jgi:hypothetical protein
MVAMLTVFSMVSPLISITWLHLLHTRLTPLALVTHHIIHMNLGGKTEHNPDNQALLDHHGYVTQLT